MCMLVLLPTVDEMAGTVLCRRRFFGIGRRPMVRAGLAFIGWQPMPRRSAAAQQP
jgi:hypothetical protein